jgi:hypothetical protein
MKTRAIKEKIINTTNGTQKTNNKLVVWTIAVTIALLAFYGLDHLVMSIQGLPLNWDLTPAQ